MLSQRNIASNIVSLHATEDFRETDVNLAFLPFHHTFGSTALLVLLSSGAATAFPDGLRYVAQNLKEYKVTFFIGVPLLIESIYKKVEKEIEKQGKTKLINFARKFTNILDKCGIHIKRKVFKQVIDNLGGDLRMIISGAAGLDKNVSAFFNEIGIKTLQGYGLTETAPVVSAENCKYIKYGSVGFPMKNVTVEIVDKDEQGIGELRVKGPNVMLGYYENEEATKAVLRDGWYYTGDYGYIDPEGFIFITGRKKNMIVLKNGKKIFPEEVEELINKIDLVKESMVFGMPKGDDLLVSVKVQYDEEIAKEKYSNMTSEELEKTIWTKIKEINKTLPTYKYVKNLIMTKDDFIKTTTAKIKRFEEVNKILATYKA
jgi:long-chain acyl-CoA synthetase